ncbi:TPA_asm: hypothetical protein HUJ06_000159 [Nelumbo nucifera]|uniref:Uncharacterized protein n=1 Tax=Nelumbo nucifera TaxID=4432 RepID=A0A822ZZ78_NELNU|nr:TPA_asm: hypothetical protein HUJ06_000159 [Nelumbo nucifera]
MRRILGPFAARSSLLNGNDARTGLLAFVMHCGPRDSIASIRAIRAIVGPAIVLHLSGGAADLKSKHSAHVGACARLPREEGCIHSFFKSKTINGGEQDSA